MAAFSRGVAWYLRRLPEVWVEGEVTELRRADAWATVFLTLRDATTGAALPTAILRRRFDALDLGLRDGEKVHVLGRLELYEARGEVSFKATTIERVGLGDKLAAIERLRQALAAEGLFASERKRRLPRFPRAVGLLTGTEAAARGDVVTALAARFPATTLVVLETRVQGSGAPEAIANGLRALDADPRVDVIILARGGGSLDDLLPFSSETVVRAVAASRAPIVSAVGHEQDTPLCDLAADARASTPTAAVRLVVPDREELQVALEARHARLAAAVRHRAARDRERLDRQATRLRAAPALLVERRRAAIDRAGVRLSALSPRATLERGYAIVRHAGVAVKSSAALERDAVVDVELAAGGLSAAVIEVRP